MIKAEFIKDNDRLTGFALSGHAGQGTAGNDVCCAAVSSAAELTVNTVTDFFGCNAEVKVEENRLYMKLISPREEAMRLIESFRAHLELISEEFPRGVRISEK